MRIGTVGPEVILPRAERRRVRMHLDLQVLRDPAWLQWMAVLALLVLHLRGAPYALGAAIAVCLVAALLVLLRRRSLRPFGVQIPLGYTVLLLTVLIPPVHPLLYLPFAGTIVRVLTGYCAMSRLLMLMPWNREGPLTLAYFVRVWLSPQVGGGVFRWSRSGRAPEPHRRAASPPLRIASCKDR